MSTSTTSNGTTVEKCQWCGQIHGPQCPSVKALEYYPNGAVKRVEFKTGSEVPTWTIPANWQSPVIT